MVNTIYIESYTSKDEFIKSSALKLPLVSLITYNVYKYCSPEEVTLNLVFRKEERDAVLILRSVEDIEFLDEDDIPWQVASCIYPVGLYEDTVVTGLCGVARHICKFRFSERSPNEHVEGLLGFRKSCLQAPNEVSIWTKFCEVDIIKTLTEIISLDQISEVPKNLVRFENHLSKPVRVHNVYKLARDIKKENQNKVENIEKFNQKNAEHRNSEEKSRTPKTRKWKSKAQKDLEMNCRTKIEDLDISHQFAEGPFLTLADVILLPSYHVLFGKLGQPVFESLLPLTYTWYTNLLKLQELAAVCKILKGIDVTTVAVENMTLPRAANVSLYKCDPKRHNPKKRLYTKEDDVENALNILQEGMEINLSSNGLENGIDWNSIPAGANPSAGHLPDERMVRKSQQLENLALAVLDIAKDGDLIVDFCSGSGHLGILLAYLLPNCTIILLENKEQSLIRARTRVHNMGLTNVFYFQCNLDFFIGKFDIGVALHACGIASDLVLDKCLKANAKFVLCPCCYGSLQETDRFAYPRSHTFKNVTINQYLCIGHAADQTHDLHPLMVRGARCMAVIDSDRGRLAEEFGYKVTLSRLKPLTCTPKNNLLIGLPS